MKPKLFLSLLLFLLAACNLAPTMATSQPAPATAAPTLPPAQPPTPTQPAHANPSQAPGVSPIPSATPLPLPSPIGNIEIPGAAMVYYDIYGSSEAELRKQLDAKQPVGYDGYRGDSTTSWDIRWNWPGRGKNTCNLSAATVTLAVRVTFPRWMPPQNASPELVTKWTQYVQALTAHETNHVNSVIARFKSVETAIKNATCQTAEAAAQAALKPIHQFDVDYDAVTNHGETEGARFP